MELKLSVFLSNVGSFSDRFCSAYSDPYTVEQMFERVASIPAITAVDLVGTWNITDANVDRIKAILKQTGLKVASLVPDHFADPRWGKGSFTSIDPAIRQEAVASTKRMMDLAAELHCPNVTIWPGQDGYDYILQTDYLMERNWFAEGLKACCRHRRDVEIGLEYKIKEPRLHCYIGNMATALLMVQEIDEPNCTVTLDFGHSLFAYENPGEAVALAYKYGNRLRHIHINDNYRFNDDDLISGSVHTLEYLEFFYWLDRTGYSGYLTIDQFPYREDSRDAAAESAEWLSALHRIAERTDKRQIAEVLRNKDAVGASRLLRGMLLG